LTVLGSGVTAGQQVNFLFGKAASANNQATLIYHHVGDGSSSNYLGLGFYGADDLLNLKAGGNLLLGTTTDSSNGRIQLATHTTSAGGIGFGSDTSLFRKANGDLAVQGSTIETVLRFYSGASQYGYLYFSNTLGEINSINGPLYFKSSGTTALTLDSSQNATFAGTIKGRSIVNVPSDTTIAFAGYYTSGTGGIYNRALLPADTNGQYGSYMATSWDGTNIHAIFGVRDAITDYSLIDVKGGGSPLVKLGAALQLSNAYVAGAPAATGYVTIKDSSGTTYKVLVST
jgi:hypothetical protein